MLEAPLKNYGHFAWIAEVVGIQAIWLDGNTNRYYIDAGYENA